MKAKEIIVGRNYMARLSGKLTVLRVDEIARDAITGYLKRNPLSGRVNVSRGTRYHCTNLATMWQIVAKSEAKFIREASDVDISKLARKLAVPPCPTLPSPRIALEGKVMYRYNEYADACRELILLIGQDEFIEWCRVKMLEIPKFL